MVRAWFFYGLLFVLIILILIFLLLTFFKNRKRTEEQQKERKKIEEMEGVHVEAFGDNIFFNHHVMVKNSEIAGRGVFALKDFVVGEVVEVAPSLIDYGENFIGKLVDYVSTVPGQEKMSAIHMGYFNYYNHKDDNNASFKVDGPNERVFVTATKPIQKGEEIFIHYGDNYWDGRKDRITKI